jgi:acyl carrier protein
MTAVEDALRFAREEIEVIDPDAALEALSLDAELAELDLDSVALLSLVAALEERYGTRLSEAALLQVKTIRDLLELALDDGGRGA